MKTIEVNKLCKVNRDNIAPCRDRRKIAINVISEVEGEINFNYTLAIEDGNYCCENESFGVGLKKLHKGNDEVFVTKIEHGIEVPREIMEELYEYYHYGVDYLACGVYGVDNKLLYIAFVYNDHNGYYCHNVYIDINGDIQVDYF